MNLEEKNIKDIVDLTSKDPFVTLGAHQITVAGEPRIAVRAFIQDVSEVSVVDENDPDLVYPMKRIHVTGLFEVLVEREDFFPYAFQVRYDSGETEKVADPYRFLPVLQDFDLHLFNEGTHFQLYDRLGAHLLCLNGHEGVHFAVWAPNAKRVSVVGDFNSWDGRRNMMRMLGSSGVWEIFIPGIGSGEKYKFEILDLRKNILVKSDPNAFLSELRPDTASIVCDIEKYNWGDSAWIEIRKETSALERPLSIYELHPASWKTRGDGDDRFFSFRELAPLVVDYMKEMSFTYVELMPVQEHPFDASWGYQVTGNFAPTSRFGSPEDFMFFVDYCHQNGIGVIMDWVPAHFPKDAHSLARFDGTCLYEHEDPRQGEHKDWGTLIYNFGRNEVRSYLISNALFWCRKYHVDGLRVDAVASMLYLDYSRNDWEWIPNRHGGNENLEAIDFLRKLNEIIHAEFPGILTIAEESTAWSGVSRPVHLGGLGFTLKWNMGWMNDTLEYFSKDPVHRKYHHQDLTFSMVYAFTENFVLPISHDEVVHGKGSLLSKMPGDDWQKFANVRLLMAYMYAHPGKKLLFMGSELGERREWRHDRSVSWNLLDNEPNKKLKDFLKEVNRLYIDEKPLWEVDFEWQGFEWLDYHDWENSVISFTRYGRDRLNSIVAVFNFTPVVRKNYRIGVSEPGFYKEILNSDSTYFWGSGIGNRGGVMAGAIPWGNKKYSLSITIPPLGALYFKHEPEKGDL